mmetsp:Transcript_37900/g.85388  ORF Transcript_37900/g.85388 Transcript_37900/m.85388 type:complete len:375 (-) Transcript_37900:31-1155(-)
MRTMQEWQERPLSAASPVPRTQLFAATPPPSGLLSRQPPSLRAEGCHAALLTALNSLGADSDGSGTDLHGQLAELWRQAEATRHAASELSSLLRTKAPALRREASSLAVELNGLSAEASRQAAAAERCVASLQDRASILRSQVIEAHVRSSEEADAITRRKLILEEEVRVLERRLEADGCTSVAETARSATISGRRQIIEERIAEAEARQAANAMQAEEAVERCEARLTALREAKLDVEAQAFNPAPARLQYEAMLDAQYALADDAAASGPRPGSDRLQQAVTSSYAAVRAVQAGPNGQAEYLHSSMKCLSELVEAERRRGGLLTQQWRTLQGEDRWRTAAQGALASFAPPEVDQRFSPRLVYDWDLDLCRMQR